MPRGLGDLEMSAYLVEAFARRQLAVALVELTARPLPASATYRIHLGDAVIEVDADFDDDALARLLRVVGSC